MEIQCVYNNVQTADCTQEQEGQISQISQKSSKKTLHSSGKNIWTVESKIKLKWNETERETAHDPKHATVSVRPAGGNIMWMACMGAGGSLVFIDDVTVIV